MARINVIATCLASRSALLTAAIIFSIQLFGCSDRVDDGSRSVAPGTIESDSAPAPKAEVEDVRVAIADSPPTPLSEASLRAKEEFTFQGYLHLEPRARASSVVLEMVDPKGVIEDSSAAVVENQGNGVWSFVGKLEAQQAGQYSVKVRMRGVIVDEVSVQVK